MMMKPLVGPGCGVGNLENPYSFIYTTLGEITLHNIPSTFLNEYMNTDTSE